MSVTIPQWARTVIAQRQTAALVSSCAYKADRTSLLFETTDGRQRMVSWFEDSPDQRAQMARVAISDGAIEADVLAVIEAQAA